MCPQSGMPPSSMKKGHIVRFSERHIGRTRLRNPKEPADPSSVLTPVLPKRRGSMLGKIATWIQNLGTLLSPRS